MGASSCLGDSFAARFSSSTGRPATTHFKVPGSKSREPAAHGRCAFVQAPRRDRLSSIASGKDVMERAMRSCMSVSACPANAILSPVGPRWATHVMKLVKDHHRLNYGALRRALPEVSGKVLTKRLRHLLARHPSSRRNERSTQGNVLLPHRTGAGSVGPRSISSARSPLLDRRIMEARQRQPASAA
jgi:DNA-binding HxlR family transcriptional regulator